MAENYLNKTGLQYFFNRIKTLFENKIEKIKVNGIEQSINNKEAEVSAAEMTVSDTGDTTLLQGAGAQEVALLLKPTANGVRYRSSQYETTKKDIELASKDYVDANGGKIDKIKLNGVEQTITNKEVDLPVTIEEAINGGDTATGNDKKIKIQNSSAGTIYAEHDVSEFNAVSISKNGSTVSSEKRASHSTNGISASFRDYDANTDTQASLGYSGISMSHIIDPESSDPESPTFFNLVINKNTGTPSLGMSPNIKEAFRTQLGIASAFTYKGSVATEADLPTIGNVVGDVYDVQATGMNFAWNGTNWDPLGSYVDVSLLWAKSELVAITTAEIDEIVNA